MEQFSQAMQKYLMKMEQRCDKLKFLSSRATEETSCIMNEITENVNTIFKTHNMMLNKKCLIIDPTDKTCCITSNVVYGYKWLLLNTHFHLQNCLAEDVQYGYMVGQWPSLSPYLFIQIIWHFEYEMILAESLAHVPLDLCVEILKIVINCMHELECERARRLIIRLTGNIYKRCLQLRKAQEVQDLKQNLENTVWQLVAYFQMLLDLLTDCKITRSNELSTEKKRQEHGALIKMLLRHVKKCICMQEITDEDCAVANLFTLTYSACRDTTLPVDYMGSIVKKLEQELITLLLSQIKQVDFHEYLSWAEVDDTDNVMISLQRAIAIACQDFIQFMKRDIFPENNDHLQQCLLQFAGDSESVLTLQELCHCIINGKPEALRELMKRYTEWDEYVLNFIDQNVQLLTMDDYGILLEYLHHVFMSKCPEPRLNEICQLMLKILMHLNIPTLYSTVLRYVAMHFHDNSLVPLYKEKEFMEFIARNENILDARRLRTLLISLMLNAKAVLFTLIKIAIGSTQYSHIVFTAQNMLLLRPFICINVNSQHNMLVFCLNKICATDLTWNSKRFVHFVNVMLDNQVISGDQLMNDVYIPYLTNAALVYANLTCILLCIRDILKKGLCSDRTNYAPLVIGLVKKASSIRRCKTNISAVIVDEAIGNIKNILNVSFSMAVALNVHQQREVIDAVNELVQPIDRVSLAPLFRWLNGTAIEIIQDYERRCFVIHARIRTDAQGNVNRCKLACAVKLDRQALIRHMILHATDNEYLFFMHEMTLVNWFYFGWSSERNAFENLMSITIEAMKLVVVYNDIFPEGKFIELLCSFVDFCESIAYSLEDLKYVVNVLSLNLASLCDVLIYTPYGETFEFMLSCIQDNFTQIICKDVQKCFKDITTWINAYVVNCTPLTEPFKDVLINSDIKDLFIAYSFVCVCIKAFNLQAHSYVDGMWNTICKC